MTEHWQARQLGTLLRKSDRWILIDPEESYQEVTVRVNGKGVISRGFKKGIEIASERRMRVEPGQFIVSRIDARHGASGIVPPDLAGAVVTGDFPVFDCDRDLLKPEFLFWLAKTRGFVDACRQASEGTTNRVRLREHLFLRIMVRIPSLSEQERIARKLADVATRIDTLFQVRNNTSSTAVAMLRSEFHKLTQGTRYRPLAEVAPIIRRPVEIDPDSAYEEIGIRSFHKGTFFKGTSLGAAIAHKSMFEMVPGDLVFSNIMAWEGAIAVVRPEDRGRIGVHRFMTCVPREGVADAHFLWFFFQTPAGCDRIVAASPATVARNRTLAVRKLEAIEVPLPPYERQIRFASLMKRVAAIDAAQAANRAELDALLPAVLEKAFKGEL